MFPKKSLTALIFSLAFLSACPSTKKNEATPPAAPPAASAPSAPSAPAAPIATNAAEAKPATTSTSSAAPNLATPVDATKGFYEAVVGEKYDVAWASLTKASQDKFISMVASDEKMDPAKVRELFEKTEPSIRLGFWASFRNSSKLETVVPTATYKVLNEGPELAEVEMTSGQTVLKSKAIKENGQWKMGYVETFLP